MIEINDNESPKEIKEFIRNHPDIEFYENIQRGYNGIVYFGKRKKLDDHVVLKFYWAQEKYNESEEAVILQKIDHKNILKIYDLRFLKPDYAYFLSPKISGGDLQVIIDTKKLSTRKSLEIIAGILLGLNELHSNYKLVHRDLKPSNILIDSENLTPIIADLGSVKKISCSTNNTSASKSTPLYLPPESIISEEYFFQSDIYQVTIVFFQLLGGFFPINAPEQWLSEKEKKQFHADKNKNLEKFIINKIKKGNLANVSTLPPYLDKSIINVLKKGLNIDYRKRYLNCSLFLNDIHKLLSTRPDYNINDCDLFITHQNNIEFKIYGVSDNKFNLEKKVGNGSWRKVSHLGTYESALELARKN